MRPRSLTSWRQRHLLPAASRPEGVSSSWNTHNKFPSNEDSLGCATGSGLASEPLSSLQGKDSHGVAEKSRSNYSLDIMRLHPLTADLEHIASSSSMTAPPRAPCRSGLVSHYHEDAIGIVENSLFNASSQPLFRVAMHSVSAEASPGTCSPGEEDSTRRHRCPHCGKGFNRPSSLETHVNTHTGAKRTSSMLSESDAACF